MSAAARALEGLRIRKVHPHVGAEITGVDLRQPLAEEVFAAIEQAFHEHSVLVFHDQDITDEQQVAFSARFGTLERTSFSVFTDNPHVYRLSNVDENGKVLPLDDRKRVALIANSRWHTDSSFRAIPAKASILSGREVPRSEAGDTQFASMRVGWDTLPASLRGKVRGLVGVHSYAYTLSHFENHGITDEEIAKLPPVSHPIVRTDHPSGRESLYVSGHVERIEGMDLDEGRALVRELIDWCTRPDYVYSHRWRRHDLVMWDNRCALHRATNIPATEPRLMHRTTVTCDGPVT